MPGNKGQGSAMTPSDASRIQSAQARSGGDMSSGSFAARAQSAGVRNENTKNSSYGHQTNSGQRGGDGGNTASSQGKK